MSEWLIQKCNQELGSDIGTIVSLPYQVIVCKIKCLRKASATIQSKWFETGKKWEKVYYIHLSYH